MAKTGAPLFAGDPHGFVVGHCQWALWWNCVVIEDTSDTLMYRLDMAPLDPRPADPPTRRPELAAGSRSNGAQHQGGTGASVLV